MGGEDLESAVNWARSARSPARSSLRLGHMAARAPAHTRGLASHRRRARLTSIRSLTPVEIASLESAWTSQMTRRAVSVRTMINGRQHASIARNTRPACPSRSYCRGASSVRIACPFVAVSRWTLPATCEGSMKAGCGVGRALRRPVHRGSGTSGARSAGRAQLPIRDGPRVGEDSGQDDSEPGAAIRSALDFDAPAVCSHELVDDGQADAGSTCRA